MLDKRLIEMYNDELYKDSISYEDRDDIEIAKYIFAHMDNLLRVTLMEMLGVYYNANIPQKRKACVDYILKLVSDKDYVEKKLKSEVKTINSIVEFKDLKDIDVNIEATKPNSAHKSIKLNPSKNEVNKILEGKVKKSNTDKKNNKGKKNDVRNKRDDFNKDGSENVIKIEGIKSNDMGSSLKVEIKSDIDTVPTKVNKSKKVKKVSASEKTDTKGKSVTHREEKDIVESIPVEVVMGVLKGKGLDSLEKLYLDKNLNIITYVKGGKKFSCRLSKEDFENTRIVLDLLSIPYTY